MRRLNQISMTVTPAVRRLAIAAPAILSLTACEWFTDFKRMPMVTTWEQDSILKTVRGAPQGSVPRSGTAVSAMQVSYTNLPFQIDTIGMLAQNPTPVTEASLANGHKYYQINCAVCHGNAGDANGGLKKVNPAYAFAPSLLTPSATGRSDGYIYGIIRNGRGVMPNYNRIEDHDRWDVVNYVRTLQKGTADTTLIGYPGQNGTTVPGPSLTAPTRPAPFLKPTQQPTPGSPALNSGTFKGLNERDKMRDLHGSSHEAKGGAESKEKHE